MALQDTDLLLINRSSSSYKVTWADLKTYLKGNESGGIWAYGVITASNNPPSVLASRNISSVTDLGVGRWTISFNKPVIGSFCYYGVVADGKRALGASILRQYETTAYQNAFEQVTLVATSPDADADFGIQYQDVQQLSFAVYFFV